MIHTFLSFLKEKRVHLFQTNRRGREQLAKRRVFGRSMRMIRIRMNITNSITIRTSAIM